MTKTSFLRMCVITFGVWIFSTADACAYIDPGSTSYLFQIVIGGLTALAFFFGSIRRRAKRGIRWFFRGFRKDCAESAIPPESVAPNDV